MDLAADVAKEKFVQKIIDFEKVPSVSVHVLFITLAIYYYLYHMDHNIRAIFHGL